MRNDSGYSLAELMTVIAIAAIVSAFAVPNYLDWREKHKLSSATGDILSAIQACKSRAIRDGMTVVLDFDFGAETYSAFRDDNRNGIQDTGERSVTGGSLPAGIDLKDGTLGSQIGFSSQGLTWPSGTSGTVQLSGKTGTKIVEINLTGSARIQ